ncbi:MAG: serine/threonine-protein kinase [Candidatus Latescibacteria bacterium]|nr:serine/threonine-protein kinase [Candidatus Latescibacterota bacterium]
MSDDDRTQPFDPEATAHTGPPVSPNGPVLPARVGRYRPLRILGQGGMGVVYEAEQDEPRRRVALKVIRPELATAEMRRRFSHESLFLGRLQHPGIAQVYEAGTADTDSGPVPFIAMELVDGVRLGVWDREQAPDLRARIELMIRLCDAVHHAHQRGLIHRDLKPGNVLVDAAGHPRVLDFGVARTADADFETSLVTTHGELVGTLAYMSPEQLAGDPGDLDTRSDVYALGVMLYELLAGRPPLALVNRPLEEALRAIREQEPPPLSSHDPHLAGDLTVIAATAMAKDREQRYASANGLGLDLQRYLDDQPIAARTPGTVYLLRKFARRHRPLVIGAVGVALTLILGVVASTLQAVRATRAERLAEARLDQAETVTGFLQDMLAAVRPEEARGREVTVHEMLDRAAADLGGGALAGRPLVEMALRTTLGGTYRSLGRYEESDLHLRRALSLADSLLEPADPERLELMLDLARTVKMRGAGDEAEHLVSGVRERTSARSRLSADALGILADLRYEQGHWLLADSLKHQMQDIVARNAGPDSLALADVLQSRAFLAEQRGDLDRAGAHILRASAIYSAAYGADDPRMIGMFNKRGDLAHSLGRFQDADSIYREGLAIVEANYPEDHTLRGDVLWRLGVCRLAAGDPEAAEQALVAALDIRRRALGPVHRDIALTLQSLADVRKSQGRLDEAETDLTECRIMREQIFGRVHPSVAAAMNDLGLLARTRGQPTRAESLLVQAQRIIEQLPESTGTLASLNAFYLAMSLQDQGRHQDAEVHFRRSLELNAAQYPGPHPVVARAQTNLATCLFRQGRKQEAADLQGESLAMLRTLGVRGSALLLAIGNTAFMLDDADRLDEAAPLHREYIEIAGEVYAEQEPGRTDARLRYFDNLARRQRWAEAEEEARAIIGWRERFLPDSDFRSRSGGVFLAEALLGQGRSAAADSVLVVAEVALQRYADVPEKARQRFQRVRAEVDAAHGRVSASR